MSDWNLRKARENYGIPYWGGGYFDINEAGHIIARPDRDKTRAGIEFSVLIDEIREQDLSLPVLVRFTGILRDRVDVLNQSFARAMEIQGYGGQYTAVYPIKVNQQRAVVEEIRNHGAHRVGLEAGSKPELLAVLGLSDINDGIVVCNGYKDREYIRLALLGRRLGLRIFIVIEKPSELEFVIEEAARMQITPLLGVRMRLASVSAGKWQNSGGDKSKFGLSAAQLLRMLERLRETDMLASLQMIHFHMGSQVANIRDIQRSMRECARFYAELHAQQVDIRYVDVGGGLGVDYEGSRSRSDCSMNYDVQEYANNIVHTLWEICEEHTLPHPHILTESGRAMTAHHAVLLTEVIDWEPAPEPREIAPAHADEPAIIHNLLQCLENSTDPASSHSLLESWHDTVYWMSEARSLYQHGIINLEQRARIEEIYYATCHRVRSRLNPGIRAHRELIDDLNEQLADKFFCNFSLFQSLPDAWAIGQIFPVVPLQRLNEQPQRRAIIHDITCDSDGRIEHYIDHDSLETTLPLHTPRQGEPYVLGIFLLGAYQEILGDLHNLFGDTDSVNVELLPDGSHQLSGLRQGDTVEQVLRYVNFDTIELRKAYRDRLKAKNFSEAEYRQYINLLEAGLPGYTYLEE